MSSTPSFEKFLNEKPLYYEEIDHQRVHVAYALLKPHIKQPFTIHIVGTNGKGSTGRILASLLHFSGKAVGHFSSPHILKFNERIWIEGEDSSDEVLALAHDKLYRILGQKISDMLSYFEYTTLLAFVAMEHLDVMILEAGLGGEFDATNVISKELSIITPIGLDHQDFLGNSIESIAQTKLNSITKKALIGFQPYPTIYTIAKNIAKQKDTELYLLEQEEISPNISSIFDGLGWAEYLLENTLLAKKALDILAFSYNLNSLNKVELFGRFYPILPNVRVDVGHNLLAAKVLTKALKKCYNSEKVILIYNSLKDKDYKNILFEFKKYISHVEILSIETERAIEDKCLKLALSELEIRYKRFETIDVNNTYFVFGSFYVVETFLNKIEYNIKNK